MNNLMSLSLQKKYQFIRDQVRKQSISLSIQDQALANQVLQTSGISMESDFNQLAYNASQDEINLIFKHCSRLRDLLGDKQAYCLLDNLLQERTLAMLEIMSDDDIIDNFIRPSKKIKTDLPSPSYHQSKSKDSQIQQSSWGRPQTESLKNIEEKPSLKDNLSKLNQKPKLKQKEETQQDRLKREILNIFQECQHLIKSPISHHTQLISLAFEYKQKTQVVLKESQINSKASNLRGRRPDKSNIFQYLQLVDSALYYSTSGHRLRETQILALLLFLISGSRRMLLEILTGEGKSTTVSCLAAILTISGKAVDIVTTSQLLAKRDVDEQTKFYKLMGLEAAHNFQQNQKGEKACYTNNKIVYGIPHMFQVDILLNDYKKKETRCNRPFQVLIVDEVDSMFIDQKQHQTLLSTTYPGFSELVYPMKIIWNRINMNPVFKQEGKFKIALAMGKDQTITGEAKIIMEEVVKDIRKTFNNEIIPEWRMEFVMESLEKWIESAISAAFVLKEKTQYIVRNNKIVPIDYKNNGSLQENVHWTNGLHQFLEIKHGLPVTTEGMTSNFISNLGHFDKYQELYGLTGTLGSEKSKEFLQKTYQTELFKVPPFKERRLTIQPGKVLYDETDWANYICQSISYMLISERSVLILCQSIQDVDKLVLAINTKQIKKRRLQELKTGEEKIDDRIDCGEIVIATNLAGRGADLKISETLNERGGLHVIISFMPINSRVEMQGRGRAGRNGYNGSSELAINYTKHCEEIGLSQQPRMIFENTRQSDPSFFCEIRDGLQIQRMKKDDENVQQLRAKDRIFKIYCDGMNEIPDFQKNTAKQKALEEKWAMFLKKADNGQIPYGLLEGEANNLVDKLKKNSDSYYTPNHNVERGINELCEGRRDAAINYFQKAQNNDSGSLPKIIGGIYGSCCKINADKENKDNIASCIKELRNTQQLIKNRKQMRKGFRINDLQNANVTNFHAQQLENDTRSFQRNIRNRQNQFEVFSQLNKAESLQSKDELKQNILKMSTGQDRILDGLSKNIDELTNTFANLGQNQYVEVDFEPISKILQTIEGDQKENKDALDRFRPEGLHFLPTGVIKKKKVSWWKRVGIFLLGVAQIVVGAIITASTAGALTGFGLNMMIEGAKCCFDSIFKPDKLNDLKKYFSQIAMNYAFALAASGLEGIKQLGTLSSNGVKMFNKMPIGQFLGQALKSTKKGLGIGIGGLFGNSISFQDKAKVIISRGLAHMISHKNSKEDKQNNLRGLIEDPIQRIKQNKDKIQGKIDLVQKQQEEIDRSVEQIASEFTAKITEQIRRLISSLDRSLVRQLKNLPIDPQHLNIVIKQTLKQGLKLPEGNSTKGLLTIFAEEIKKNNLHNMVEAFTKVIKLRQNIEICLGNIGKFKKYDLIVKQGIKQLMSKSFQKVTKIKRDSLTSEEVRIKQKYEYLKTNGPSMVNSIYKNQAQNYKMMETQFNAKVQTYNNFIKQQIKFDDLLNTIEQKKGIVDGRIQPQVINSLSLHEYSKEALRSLQYSDSSIKSFEESLEAGIFNIVGNYGLKMINTICQHTHGKKAKLDEISKLLRSDA